MSAHTLTLHKALLRSFKMAIAAWESWIRAQEEKQEEKGHK